MPRNEPNVHYAAIGKALSVPVAAAAKRADEQKTRAAWLEAFSLAAKIPGQHDVREASSLPAQIGSVIRKTR